MIKIFGLRISLDEVEVMLEKQFVKPIACFGEEICCLLLLNQQIELADLAKKRVSELYGIAPTKIHSTHRCVAINKEWKKLSSIHKEGKSCSSW